MACQTSPDRSQMLFPLLPADITVPRSSSPASVRSCPVPRRWAGLQEVLARKAFCEGEIQADGAVTFAFLSPVTRAAAAMFVGNEDASGPV